MTNDKVKKDLMGRCEPFDRLRIDSAKQFDSLTSRPEAAGGGLKDLLRYEEIPRFARDSALHRIATALRASQ